MIRSLVCLLCGALAAGGVFYFATRDTHDTAWWAAECEREELQGRLDLYKTRLGSIRHESGEENYQAALKQKYAAIERIQELKVRVEELRVSVREAAASFAAVRRTQMAEARARCVGGELDRFVAYDGRIFEQAKVVSVDDRGVILRHLHGSTTIRYADLSDEQRNFFGLEETSSTMAEKAEAEEIRALAAYHKHVDKIVEEEEMNRSFERALASYRPETVFITKKPVRKTRMPVVASVQPVLRIGSLASPPRKVGPGRRIYTRTNNTTIYYSAPAGNRVISPGTGSVNFTGGGNFSGGGNIPSRLPVIPPAQCPIPTP